MADKLENVVSYAKIRIVIFLAEFVRSLYGRSAFVRSNQDKYQLNSINLSNNLISSKKMSIFAEKIAEQHESLE